MTLTSSTRPPCTIGPPPPPPPNGFQSARARSERPNSRCLEMSTAERLSRPMAVASVRRDGYPQMIMVSSYRLWRAMTRPSVPRRHGGFWIRVPQASGTELVLIHTRMSGGADHVEEMTLPTRETTGGIGLVWEDPQSPPPTTPSRPRSIRAARVPSSWKAVEVLSPEDVDASESIDPIPHSVRPLTVLHEMTTDTKTSSPPTMACGFSPTPHLVTLRNMFPHGLPAVVRDHPLWSGSLSMSSESTAPSSGWSVVAFPPTLEWEAARRQTNAWICRLLDPQPPAVRAKESTSSSMIPDLSSVHSASSMPSSSPIRWPPSDVLPLDHATPFGLFSHCPSPDRIVPPKSKSAALALVRALDRCDAILLDLSIASPTTSTVVVITGPHAWISMIERMSDVRDPLPWTTIRSEWTAGLDGTTDGAAIPIGVIPSKVAPPVASVSQSTSTFASLARPVALGGHSKWVAALPSPTHRKELERVNSSHPIWSELVVAHSRLVLLDPRRGVLLELIDWLTTVCDDLVQYSQRTKKGTRRIKPAIDVLLSEERVGTMERRSQPASFDGSDQSTTSPSQRVIISCGAGRVEPAAIASFAGDSLPTVSDPSGPGSLPGRPGIEWTFNGSEWSESVLHHIDEPTDLARFRFPTRERLRHPYHGRVRYPRVPLGVVSGPLERRTSGVPVSTIPPNVTTVALPLPPTLTLPSPRPVSISSDASG